MPEGIRVVDAVARRHGIRFEWNHFDWSCETYARTGRMMPQDGLDELRPHDAILLGEVGFPGVPDHISLWGLLISIRRVFEEYVNLRPGSWRGSLRRSRTASRATSSSGWSGEQRGRVLLRSSDGSRSA